jgi:hypothetical protein
MGKMRTITHSALNGFNFLMEKGHEGVIDVALNKDTRAGDARLAGSYKSSKSNPIDGRN